MSFPIQTILSVSESHRVNPFQSLRTITAGQELNTNKRPIRTLPQRLSVLNFEITTISIDDYTIIYSFAQQLIFKV